MRTEAENYEVVFGSNLISQCSSVLKIVGRGINKQIMRFREGRDGKILFNCTVKNQDGRTVARVLEFAYLRPRKFKLNGIFYFPGYKIIATDDYLEVNTNRFSNNTFRNLSAAIGIQ